MINSSLEQMIRLVAVIGVGRMGGPMAANLRRAGFDVRAYDTAREQLADVAKHGIVATASVADAVDGVDAIVLMLPSDDALIETMERPDGLLEHLLPGVVVIDMGTSKLATSQRLSTAVAQRGAIMLDAPVSGGVQGARDATLSIMVGGERGAFERCRPLLQGMGSTVTYIGANGMGLIAKLVNQMLMEASFCAIAEAFALAAKAGADLEAVYRAVRGGLGGSRVLDQMLPQLLEGELGSGRELTLHWKDGAYALAAAEAVQAWAPVTELTHALFDLAVAAGQGDHSASAVARVFEQSMNVRIISDQQRSEDPAAAPSEDEP